MGVITLQSLSSNKEDYYETMVFDESKNDKWIEIDAKRYKTLEEAEKGHLEMCHKWAAK
jgi:hypothetical protein